ncbi:alcohol dehydrogenase catalytic domain-containing protein [Pseudonocardia sp.]|uniref:alcohol dehydrogenase catalytic domain-containing protein n=1 Tax=Pseudonocardia sp. TaxID=60912 RepID=UPI003D0C0E2E
MPRSVKAAVQWEIGQKWTVEEVELADPIGDEVLVEVKACGLCHSDDHNITGDAPSAVPVVGGHEASGIVRAIGPAVNRVQVGDRVVLVATPFCGKCAYCATGRGALCDQNAFVMKGHAPEGHYRFTKDGTGIGSYAQVGGFAEWTVMSQTQVIKIDDDIPFEVAAIVACGIATGYGSSVNVAAVRPGDTVVVVGVGGVGVGAVQGAVIAGAASVIAVDPLAPRRDAVMRFGATHAVATLEEARAILATETRGVMAESVILTASVVPGTLIGMASDLVAKGGKLVVTGVVPWKERNIPINVSAFLMYGRTLGGNVWGFTHTYDDLPRIFKLYRAGRLKIDEMVTRTYPLHEVNEGYADMHAGVNTRGVLVF